MTAAQMVDTTVVKTSDDLWNDFKMIAGQMMIFAAQTWFRLHQHKRLTPLEEVDLG